MPLRYTHTLDTPFLLSPCKPFILQPMLRYGLYCKRLTASFKTTTGGIMQTYTGHSAKHDGLQGHSVGDLYPIIITHYGDGGSGVMLGSHEIRGFTHKTARSIATDIKAVYDRQGFNGAVIRLHALNITAVMNT